MQKKILSVLFACLLLGTMTAAATAEDITVLYTNDIHTYIDNAVGVGNETGLTYSRLAALADAEDALLVDAGDHIQGSAYGGMDEGATIIRLMNAAGYDCATPGNHEFDYGMERFLAAAEAADFPYLSCNFTRADGSLLLDSYQISERAEQSWLLSASPRPRP
ncbi:MAG: metallophosphoesterase [Butyricicoccus sp.]|nr:metallophosphoesterase [Butyricicoccus sp.]